MSRQFERMRSVELPMESYSPVGLRLWHEMIRSTEDQIRAAIEATGIAFDDDESYGWYVDILFGPGSREKPPAGATVSNRLLALSAPASPLSYGIDRDARSSRSR
jgi:hypothetical protein